ncbi:MAG: integral rane sensor signal transduction histidine kinase [Firmicutes bacterium]|nr:integral rane sensor signal transduction histidine kinase [Bacillota bacterium]
MTSIRTKLFFHISFLVIFFIFVAWILSTLVLEDYYLWTKKHSLITNGLHIEDLYTSNSPDISLELERVANNLGAGIVIAGPDGTVKATSFSRAGEPKAFVVPPDTDEKQSSPRRHGPPPLILKATETIDDSTIIKIEQDENLNIDFLTYHHQLRNHDQLLMRLPLAALSESAAYASKFMVFSGIISILGGCIWAFFFAKKFTVPLLELSSVARSISQLDFTKKSTIHRNDEIGILSKSINNLSQQLNKAISELNTKNQQLLEDVEKERRLDKLRKNFISSVSHELKTPISLILGYAEGLKDNVAESEEQKEYYCSVIIDEAEKLDKLVKDLLDLSQVDSGYFHLERTDFNLSSLLERISLKYNTVLMEKDINLKLEISPALWVNGDALRIEQIIVNFLNNALDHVDSKGIITIHSTTKSDKIRISVFNTGNPIPDDSINDLWLSFYKVDKARTRAFGGYGLGLSVVRAIQDLHHNTYGVQNVDGGVEFWFELDAINNQ